MLRSKLLTQRGKNKRVIVKVLAYVFNISRATIFPTEVHQRVFTLINIHQSLPFIRCNSCTAQRHLSSAKFDEIFRRRPASMAEKSTRHLESRGMSQLRARLRLEPKISDRVRPRLKWRRLMGKTWSKKRREKIKFGRKIRS